MKEYKTKDFAKIILNLWEAKYEDKFQGCLFIYDEDFKEKYTRSGYNFFIHMEKISARI
jgi:hypothetical protein